MALWILDKETTEEKLEEKIEVKNELISFSSLIQNLDIILETNKPDTNFYFFYFDITELYLALSVIQLLFASNTNPSLSDNKS